MDTKAEMDNLRIIANDTFSFLENIVRIYQTKWEYRSNRSGMWKYLGNEITITRLPHRWLLEFNGELVVSKESLIDCLDKLEF